MLLQTRHEEHVKNSYDMFPHQVPFSLLKTLDLFSKNNSILWLA